jgi:hypothetical protein
MMKEGADAMTGTNVIEVALPDGASPTVDDIEQLEATFRAIVDLRYRGGPEWQKVERALVADGWTVRSQLMWVAEAKKGWQSELATGRTKSDAFRQLQQLARIDDLAGVP